LCARLARKLVNPFISNFILIFFRPLFICYCIITIGLFCSATGGTTEQVINKWAEDWVAKVTRVRVQFDSSEAVQLLRNLGILKEHKDRLSVLPLEAAIKNLPRQPFSVIVRANEVSLNEGMDRDEFLESETQYKKDDVKSKKYGWFSRFL
jgi:hypothetical protein